MNYVVFCCFLLLSGIEFSVCLWYDFYACKVVGENPGKEVMIWTATVEGEVATEHAV